MLIKNRDWVRNNIKSKLGNIDNTIILLKGSQKIPINETSESYKLKPESNFVYLFGLIQTDIDGMIDL